MNSLNVIITQYRMRNLHMQNYCLIQNHFSINVIINYDLRIQVKNKTTGMWDASA